MTADVRRASRGHGLRGLIVAAALAALLLSARGRVAEGAPPTLSASENPVAIAAPATTKAMTISYNLGGTLAKAMLTVNEAGGPQVVNAPLASQSGSMPLTVTYGKTYNAQIIDVSTNKAATTLQITTKRPDAPNPGPGPDPNCGQPICFSALLTQVYGTYTQWQVSSDKPVYFLVQASTDAPTPNGDFAHVDSSVATILPTTTWTGTLPNLKPNTGYHIVITANGAGNTKVVRYWGNLKTLARRVEVTFEQVHVTDDSDVSANCECTFYFKAGDAPTKKVGELKAPSGGAIHPNTKITVNNAPDNLKLRVSGFDDDEYCDPFFTPCGFCAYGAPSDVVDTNGSDSCWDWSSANTTVDVTPTGIVEEFTGTFSIIAHGGPLKFEVYGSFKVSYV